MIFTKRIVLFTLVFFGITSPSIAQISNLKVTYKVRLEAPKKENNKPIPERIEDVFRDAENLFMNLLYDNEKAIFYIDDALESDATGVYSTKIIKMILGVNYPFYQDLDHKVVYEKKEIDYTPYLLKKNIETYEWNLKKASKKVGGYECYQATTTYKEITRSGESNTVDVIAWYAPSIPISTGPKSFCGLPGLILELKEKKQIFFATNIEFAPKETIDSPFLPDIKIISKEDYNKLTGKIYSKLIEN